MPRPTEARPRSAATEAPLSGTGHEDFPMNAPLASATTTGKLAFAPRNSRDLFAPIARDLEETERILKSTLERPEPGVARLVNHLSHYRGKRLRPALLLLSAQACGRIGPAHHVLAAVVEM